MKHLIAILDYYRSACHRATDYTTRRTFFDQAFGACQYHIYIFPDTQVDVEDLWNCYKKDFEEMLYYVQNNAWQTPQSMI